MTIGARLREERERLHLSQTALAEAAGTTKKTQIDHEKDNTPPKASYLASVATLGIDVAYVITGIRLESAATTPMEMALLDNYRHSPVEVQIGISKLLAETGKALARAQSVGKD